MDRLDKLDVDELTFEEGEEELVLAQEPIGLEEQASKIIIPRCEFLTGGAGTGKTYTIRKRMEEYEPKRNYRAYGVLAATTGIAAINLGDNTTTVNSLLGYFDTASLVENYANGKLHRALKEVCRKAENLIIDEVSMMEALQLDTIWNALLEINQHAEVVEMGGLGIVLTGDFCQLPPIGGRDEKGEEIQAKFAFEAQCWKYFEKNITTLTKVWRQDNPHFVESLNHARRGDGEKAVEHLQKCGVRFCEEVDTSFDGTTIFSKNVEVDRLNQIRLTDLLHKGKKEFVVKSWRWGKQRGEWKLIPEELRLCEDAYVMILANDSKQNGFRYANGSTGYVNGFDTLTGFEVSLKGKFSSQSLYSTLEDTPNIEEVDPDDIVVETVEELINLKIKEGIKGGATIINTREPLRVEIGKIVRSLRQKDHPDGRTSKPEYLKLGEWKEQHPNDYTSTKQAKFLYEEYLRGLTKENRPKGIVNEKEVFRGEIYFDYEEGKWVVGEVHYYPLRLAYASTVHKSQGLTLDTVQIDFANKFFGSASMGYVALSRCRTAEGMRIVGTPQLLVGRINVKKKVVRWI
jgi:ATP-dependent exoDNAse (exonuclease V) alpha subunit